jgi:hypothetical protein
MRRASQSRTTFSSVVLFDSSTPDHARPRDGSSDYHGLAHHLAVQALSSAGCVDVLENMAASCFCLANRQFIDIHFMPSKKSPTEAGAKPT